MDSRIKFRMVAYTGPAGKADSSAPMGGNEDNFYVDDNLSDNIPCHFDVDKILDLADYGLIMAVADGMGGQNAGEVASGIAVKTVQEFFEPRVLNDKIVNTPDTRRIYLEKLVVEADRRIKEEAKNNPEHEGMGSTIILAWIVDDKLTITWCGDSRAYRYNPARGIELLSEDHSYVQELVKQGVISYDDTFDHPQGNIVTRSLGERGNKAQPETRQYELYKDDIILLCSDGLSGVLRDKKTLDHNGDLYPGENIEDIIKENCSSMKQCKDALWDAAERADWYDNVTIILCQILDGAPPLNQKNRDSVDNEKEVSNNKYKSFWSKSLHITTRNIAVSIGAIILMIILIVSCLWIYPRITSNLLNDEQHTDTLSSNVPSDAGGEQSEETPLSELRDELFSLLQKECAKFMNLCDIQNMEEADYFREILLKISEFDAINDTTAIKELKDYAGDFIKLTQKKVVQIEKIDRYKQTYQNNKSVIDKLEVLRNKCIHEDITDIKTSIENILGRASSGNTNSNNSNEDASEGRGYRIVRENTLTIVTDSATPIEINFNIIDFNDFMRQLNDYKNQYGQTHEFKGVYVGDAIVWDKNGLKHQNQRLFVPCSPDGTPTNFTIKFFPK